MRINTKWFHDQIEASRFGSSRQLALHMKLDPSALTRMLSGDRKMNLNEAEDLAKLLGRPVCEVLSNAGVDMGEVDRLLNALEFYAGKSNGDRARAALKRWGK